MVRRRFPTLAVLCAMIWGGVPGLAEQYSCKDLAINVTSADPAVVRQLCDAAHIATQLFASCALPDLQQEVQVEFVEALPEGCNAQYHCGENRMEILTPSAMAAQRSREGAFSSIDDKMFFRSVVVHELAHAALDPVRCPFDDCIVADEYIAYAMQVMSLPPSLQETFENTADPHRSISRDALTKLVLFMSPDGFAQNVWAHLQQRPDACDFIGKLASRETLLDRERFDRD